MDDPAYTFPVHIGDIDEFHWRAAFEDEDWRLTVLLQVRRMLNHARMGLEDLCSSNDPERRELGFYNVVVYGRSVTLAAKKFTRHYADEYETFYAPFVKAAQDDDLMRYFLKLRNALLHDVPPPIISSPGDETTPEAIAALRRLMDETPKPVNADGFIIDVTGRSGWQVRDVTGWRQTIDTPLPPYLKRHFLTRSHLPDAPKVHQGRPIEDRSLEGLGILYVEWLRFFVAKLGVWASHLQEVPGH